MGRCESEGGVGRRALDHAERNREATSKERESETDKRGSWKSSTKRQSAKKHRDLALDHALIGGRVHFDGVDEPLSVLSGFGFGFRV